MIDADRTAIEAAEVAEAASKHARARPHRLKWLVRRVVRKIATAVLVLFAAVTLVFFSLQLAPGNAVDAIAGDASSVQSRAEAAAEWGLDQPLYVQYGRYLERLAHGNLGRSYTMSESVATLIWERLLPTAQLAGTAALIAMAISISVIVLTGTGNRWAARVSSLLELVLVSMPGFWLGIILMFVFSFKLGLLPVVGSNTLLVVLLPAITLGLRIAGELIQIMRSALDKALEEPFTLSARARGVSDMGYSLRHGLRHAALPAITVAGWLVGTLLTGTFVIEQLFGRSGIGTLAVRAVLSRDTPVVMAVSLLAAAIYVGVSTVVDILYELIDPRLHDDGPGHRS